MVDPANITDFNLSKHQLEERILFWVCAAGKNGRTAAKCLDKFFKLMRAWYKSLDMPYPKSPFLAIRKMNEWHKGRPGANGGFIAAGMKICGIGCSKNKSRAFLELAYSGLDLTDCTVEDLEKIHGIGPKTARAFLIHSRPDQEYACLDTHILKFMRAKGVDAPKTTPTGKKYKEIEREFIRLARQARKSIAEFDLEIWNEYSVKPKTND